MTKERFDSLTEMERECMLISVHVRGALEPLHAEGGWLGDDRMPELNRAIREGVMDFLRERADGDRGLSVAVMMIPDYWEIPE